MISHHSAMFGGHENCGSGDMLLVIERHYSTCSHLNPSLLLISKVHGLKAPGMSCSVLVVRAKSNNK